MTRRIETGNRVTGSIERDALNLSAGAGFILIFVASLVVYWPALSGDFLWDDAGHVTAAQLRSVRGLARIWFEIGATQQYYPLLHSAFWLEHKAWGDSAVGYHLMNILQHAGAAAVFGGLLRRLQVPGAWLAAFCFALHPVAVESVAWIAEQKNTLSTLLGLGSALVYLRFDASRRGSTYALSTTLFVLALLTKTVTATLPAALLVLLWWKHGRVSLRRDVIPLLPWIAAGATMGLLTATFERTQIGAEGTDFALSFLERGLLAAKVVWFYFGKLVWPSNLSFVYPRWVIQADDTVLWVSTVALLVALIMLFRGRNRSRGPLAVALLFIGTLFPVLGFVNVYPFVFSYVADHFQYLASLPMFAGLGALTARLGRKVGLAVLLLTCPALGLMSWQQAGMYRDDMTLFRRTLEKNPSAWLAHNNLGTALVEAGRPAEAVPHFETVLRLRPNHAEAHNNLGDALTRLGRPAEALPHLQRAVQVRPGYASAHNNLGVALMKLGRPGEGRVEFENAVRLKPDFALGHFNLGLAAANDGNASEAAIHFERAVQHHPQYAEAELNWAVALTLTDRFTEAVPHFERALKLRPDYAQGEVMFGRALSRAGRYDEAAMRLRRAVDLEPQNADAHFNLSLVLRQMGDLEEAERHLTEANRHPDKR